MFRYLSLIRFTDEGIQNINSSTKRADAFRDSLESSGGRVIEQYWAVGSIDGAVIFETPDEAAASTALLHLAKLGFVRTETQRIYTEDEFKKIAKGV